MLCVRHVLLFKSTGHPKTRGRTSATIRYKHLNKTYTFKQHFQSIVLLYFNGFWLAIRILMYSFSDECFANV